jgi:hypothetical protein
MSHGADASLEVPARPVLRNPKGPVVYSLKRSYPDTLVLAPAQATGWPSRANMSLSGWLALYFFLGGMILLGALSGLAMIGLVLALPAYWTVNALGRGAWSEAVAGATIELLLLTLLALAVLAVSSLTLLMLAVLAVSSGGRWVTFDRRHGLLTISRRPFGWRRSPRVVSSQSLAEVVAVQLVYGGVSTSSHPSSLNADQAPSIEFEYDWYEFNLVLRGHETPRFNLASGTDWMWMGQAGAEIAQFLGVPLVDQRSHRP